MIARLCRFWDCYVFMAPLIFAWFSPSAFAMFQCNSSLEPVNCKFYKEIRKISWLDNERLVVSAGGLYLIDLAKKKHTYFEQEESLDWFTCARSLQKVVGISSQAGKILCFDMNEKNLVSIELFEKQDYQPVCLSRKNQSETVVVFYLGSSTGRQSLIFYDITQQKIIKTAQVQRYEFDFLSWTSENALIGTSCAQQPFFCNLTEEPVSHQLLQDVVSAESSNLGNAIFLCNKAKGGSIRSLPTYQLQEELINDQQFVFSRWKSDDKQLLIGTRNDKGCGSLLVYDSATKSTKTILTDSAPPKDACYSTTGRYISIAGGFANNAGSSAYLYDTFCKKIVKISNHDDIITGAKASPGETYFAAASLDKKLIISAIVPAQQESFFSNCSVQ